MKKKSLFKDSIYATGFILISVYLLSLIEFNSDLLNPIARAFGDFKITDVVFSKMRENPPAEERIVVVNIGNLPREGIAEMVEIINSAKPKVIAIDARFEEGRDPKGDSMLASAFSKVDNLVMACELHENTVLNRVDSMTSPYPLFHQYAELGFVDMISEGEDLFKTSRDIGVKEKVPHTTHTQTISLAKDTVFNGIKTTVRKDTVVHVKENRDTTYYSFAVKVASVFAPDKVEKLLTRNTDTETINWQGNIDMRKEGVSSGSKIVFPTIDWVQVLTRQFEPDIFENNIVLLGFMGSEIGEHTLVDIFYTPLNNNYIGKANPDMFGVVIHANIISMILKENYINEMPGWLNIALSVFLIFINVWFFSYLYFRTELWYDGLSLLITLGEILVLTIMVVVVFNYYNYNVDISFASAALFLTGNLIEIHFGIVKPTALKIMDKMPGLTRKLSILTKN